MNALSNFVDDAFETALRVIVLAIIVVVAITIFASIPGGQAVAGMFNGVLNFMSFAEVIGTIIFVVSFVVWLLRLFDRQPGAI